MKQAIVSGASEMGLSNLISIRLNPNLNSVKLCAAYLFNLFSKVGCLLLGVNTLSTVLSL